MMVQRRGAHPRRRDGSETALHEEQHLGRSPADYCIFLVLEVYRGAHPIVQEEAIAVQNTDLADGFAQA